MDINEKLQIMTARVMADAQEEASSSKENAEKRISEAMSHIEMETLKKTYSEIQHEIDKIRREESEKLSMLNEEAKLNILAKQSEIKKAVFDGVTAKISNYLNTDEYKTSFSSKLENALSLIEGHSYFITVTKADEKLLKLSEQCKKVIIDDSIIGYFIIRSEEKGILINESITALLEKAKDGFYGIDPGEAE
ncbi:MAG: V-type ATP synthase subunit E family protein [Bacillota bacterium]|nr:V-type ATP synthase subunit E family protein [Bacillota bacterium]